MWTLFFDIDGTLLNTRGAGSLALERAMQQMFDIPELPHVEYAGRTDRAIIPDLFHPHQIDVGKHYQEFSELYWQFLPAALEELDGEVLPGVNQLLETLFQRSDVSLGIITGNARKPAGLKLEKFGLQHYFSFGGYGDKSACRNDVAAEACNKAQEFLGQRFDNSKMWVVGDTVDDVSCGRSIGSRVLAVETGSGSRSQLTQALPELVVSTLRDSEQFLGLLDID